MFNLDNIQISEVAILSIFAFLIVIYIYYLLKDEED